MKLVAFVVTLSLLCVFVFTERLNAQRISTNSIVDEIIASAHTNDIYFIDNVTAQCAFERVRIGREMLNVVSNSASLNINKCTAAYYLGELRYVDAVGVLVDHISLELDHSDIEMHGLVDIRFLKFPAYDALTKIGVPSIPKLVHNLQESDDVKVRELSLKAIYKIENDKDIVQMRLQKALTVEKDAQKQARLQLALKALSEMKNEK